MRKRDGGSTLIGRSKKAGVVGGGVVALMLVGAGVAMAANSGYMSVSTDGSYVSRGYYNFTYPGCRWTPGGYDGYVSGTFVVTTATDHLNAKVDEYGYAKLVQANKSGRYPYSSCLSARDVLVHSSINVQVCREHWYSDDCHSITAKR